MRIKINSSRPYRRLSKKKKDQKDEAAREKKESNTNSQSLIFKIPNYLIDRRKPVPLDQMVLESIGQVDSKNIRNLLYETIVITGGGANLVGLKDMLKDRLLDIKPREHPHIDVYNCNEFFREPNTVSWQGMQVISGFLLPNDFIDRSHYEKGPIQALREKLHFLFDNNENKKI
jgi:actin-related protein